jgi:hypothetical protein
MLKHFTKEICAANALVDYIRKHGPYPAKYVASLKQSKKYENPDNNCSRGSRGHKILRSNT